MKKYTIFFILLMLSRINTTICTPVVDVRFPGALGNRFFEFCIGKTIADKLNFKLYCKPIFGFPNTYSYINNVPLPQYPTEFIDSYHPTFTDGLHNIDIEKITNNRRKRNIRIEGYFQHYKYIKPYRDLVRNDWFKPDGSMLPEKNVDDIVIHIRSSNPPISLPFEYYENALAQAVYKRIFICTDEPDHSFLENFKKYNPIVYSNDSLIKNMEILLRQMDYLSWVDHISQAALNDFFFIMSFNKIIISHSTFAWWAAYLSDATEIYAPWSNQQGEGIKYHSYGMVDEERYHYIETIIGYNN